MLSWLGHDDVRPRALVMYVRVVHLRTDGHLLPVQRPVVSEDLDRRFQLACLYSSLSLRGDNYFSSFLGKIPAKSSAWLLQEQVEWKRIPVDSSELDLYL